MEEKEEYPEGHFAGMWMGISIGAFSGIGIPIGIILGNPAFFGIGPAIGVALGAAVGLSVEAKYKREGKIRPLTEDEQSKRKLGVKIGIGLFILGLITLLIITLS